MIAPPRHYVFPLLRYFSWASLAVLLLVAATMFYLERAEGDFFRETQREQNAFSTQALKSFAIQAEATALADFLRIMEAANVDLTRLLANALWDKSMAPLVAGAQRIPVEHCRAIADVPNPDGATAPPTHKQACLAAVGREIMAFPGFKALDARVREALRTSTVFKIKVYDLRGVTVYSSEHRQIGEDKSGNVGWRSAAAGIPASQLSRRGEFGSFEVVVNNRDLIESYVPVLAPASGETVGVFEIYSDVTSFVAQLSATAARIAKRSAEVQAQMDQNAAAKQAEVDSSAKRLLAILFGLLALLWCALFLIVRHGQRIITRNDLEQQKAEEALRQRDEHLRFVADHAPVLIAHCDHQQRYKFVNRPYAELFGLRPADVIGKHAREVLGDELYAQARSRMVTALAGRTVEYDVELQAPGGARAIHVTYAPERDASGLVVGFLAAIVDIGERKKLETELRETRDYLSNLLDYANAPIIVWDSSLRITMFNHAFERLTGREAGAVIGKKIDILFPAERMDEAMAHIGQTAGGKRWETVEIPILRANGEIRTALWNSATLFSADGKSVLATIAQGQDITERKLHERALEQSESRFRGLVEQAIAGIYIIQDGKFAYVNPRLAEIVGYDSTDELIGRDPLATVAEKDRALVARNIRERIEGTISRKAYEFAALRRDGSLVEVGVHSVRAMYEGRPAIIGMLQDIAEKKSAADQIQRYVERLRAAFMSTVEVAMTLSERRDPYTAGHERRVGKLGAAIGAELGFDEQRVEGLLVAGYLHDIGKITIPAEILAKPGKLSPIELALIREHAQAGYEVLKSVSFPWPVAAAVLQHHERLDGSGYPDGLKGEDIIPEARVLAVADVVEAMSSHRPYRPALGIDSALAEIERGRGSVYDAEVADACLTLFREKGYTIPA